MERIIFVVAVLCAFVLTNQGKEENQSMPVPKNNFDMDLFEDLFNTTFPSEEELSPACSQTVHDLSSTGLLIIYIAVFVLGVTGNSVVVYVVCCMVRQRTTTDTFLMHLALADLLFALTLPFWAVRLHTGWIFGNVLCKLLSGLQEATVYGSVFLLACISVDRYFAIVKATRVLVSRRHLVGLVCGVVWLVATMLSLPVAVQIEAMQPEDLGSRLICYENLTGESGDHWRVSVRVIRHTLGFFLPLVVIIFCYGWSSLTLLYTRNQQKHKAMRIILLVVLGFVLCWLPYNVTVLIDTLVRGRWLGSETCHIQNRVDLVLYITQLMAFMHCAVNPVLYAFIGQKFRNQLLLALYKHGFISKRIQVAYRKGSVNSTGSSKSRNTSDTL
ncbi:C-X-C chemokine receptor type 1 [Lampris incognitus]|uniref:C-X-C chemokine receptor type 1 n=1 Tax=Lampris incognitus TaxID=2546036 RepID=UPI0024B518DA|nr:C-X-C chemokine receptor type 1 [Lampris incognitus]